MKTKISLIVFFIISSVLLTVSSGCGGGRSVRTIPEKGYIFYPPLPNDPKFQYLTSFSTSADVEKKTSSFFKYVAGARSVKVRPIIKPYGVEIFEGIIYICDLRAASITTIDLNKRTFNYLGITGAGKLKKPVNLFIEREERSIYVADAEREQIIVFNLNGRFVRAYGKKGEFKPSDIQLYKSGIYISDMKSHQILVLDRRSGRVVRRIGRKGHGLGALYHPSNFFIFKNKIFVSDTTNFRISVFDIAGNFIDTYGQIGTRPGTFARPKGIAVDREENIYVIDSTFENLQVFNKKFELLLFMLGAGGEKHNINLPAAIYLDYDNIELFRKYIAPGFNVKYLLFISSNFGRSKINVYAHGDYEKK